MNLVKKVSISSNLHRFVVIFKHIFIFRTFDRYVFHLCSLQKRNLVSR